MSTRQNRITSDYPDTSWTLIEEAGAGQSERALARFRDLYFRSVRAYMAVLVRGTRLDANEVASDFFTDKVWGGTVLRSANRSRGRFRHFLKTCVRNYVLSARRKLRGDEALTPIDTDHHGLPTDESSARFDVEWARAILEQAVEEARRSCEEKDQGVHFEVFRRRYLVDSDHAPDWSEVGQNLEGADGKAVRLGERAARTHAETAIRHLRRAMLATLELQTGSREAAENEMLTLLAILKGAAK